MRQVNLLPQELLQQEQFRLLKKALLWVVLPTLLGLLFIHFLLAWGMRRLEVASQQPASSWHSPQVIQLQEDLERIREDGQKYFLINSDLLTSNIRHQNTADLLIRVGNSALNRVWFNDLTLNNEKQNLVVQGASYHARFISEFMLELKKIPCFAQVELDSMGKGKIATDSEVEFRIKCLLK